jgi:hypothetical protein
MTSRRTTTVTVLVLAVVSTASTACGAIGKRVSTGSPQAHAAPYAYQLPINPNRPDNGQWSTLVRMHPVTVGYRLRGIFPREWMVVAVKSLPHDGQPAAVRGWRGKQNPIWHGKLVLRLSD